MPPLIPPQQATRYTPRWLPRRRHQTRTMHDTTAFTPPIGAKAARRLPGLPLTPPLAKRRDRRRTMTYPTGLRRAAVRRGFFGRLARGVRNLGPPLTANQQLRLLQLALNVKLRREGKPPDLIRLTIVEALVAESDLVAAEPTCKRPATPPHP
jgi:hypothetical protein